MGEREEKTKRKEWKNQNKRKKIKTV